MGREIEVDAVIDLDPVLRVVEKFGVVLSTRISVRVVVVYQGMHVLCDSPEDAGEFALEAIHRHANQSRTRFATDTEVSEAGKRMADKHRASLEKLASHESSQSADAVDPSAAVPGKLSTREK